MFFLKKVWDILGIHVEILLSRPLNKLNHSESQSSGIPCYLVCLQEFGIALFFDKMEKIVSCCHCYLDCQKTLN